MALQLTSKICKTSIFEEEIHGILNSINNIQCLLKSEITFTVSQCEAMTTAKRKTSSLLYIFLLRDDKRTKIADTDVSLKAILIITVG